MTFAHEDIEEVTELQLRFGWGRHPLEDDEARTVHQVTGTWDEVPLDRLATDSSDPAAPGDHRDEQTFSLSHSPSRNAPPPPAPPPPPWPDTGLGPTGWWSRRVELVAAPFAAFIGFIGEVIGS